LEREVTSSFGWREKTPTKFTLGTILTRRGNLKDLKGLVIVLLGRWVCQGNCQGVNLAS
jgi:hypothetical protein